MKQQNTPSGIPVQSVSPPPSPASRHSVKHSRVMLGIRDGLNILVLLGSVLVIAALSFETFHDAAQNYYHAYLQIQLWVCLIFMSDFLFRFYLSERKWHYLWHNLIFLLVSIPYLNIADHSQTPLTQEAYYIFKLMPLVRGGYGLAVMVGWITRSRVTNLLVSYVVTLLALIYFSTLIFYQLEHGPNPNVTNYGSAVWWAFMNVTTVGANIFAVTPMGKVLTVVLAASGMMMFPILTVYITTKFQSHFKAQNALHERAGHEGSPDPDEPNEESAAS